MSEHVPGRRWPGPEFVMSDASPSEHRDWVRSAVDRYQGALCRYAARIVRDGDRARDIVQDTFMKLCRQSPADLDGHLAEWLFTVCRNQALGVLRKERRMVRMTDVSVAEWADAAPRPPAEAERVGTTGRALDLLARLPGRQQEVIRLKFHGGLSYREIARVTRMSVTNVGFLIHRGIKALRAKLGT